MREKGVNRDVRSVRQVETGDRLRVGDGLRYGTQHQPVRGFFQQKFSALGQAEALADVSREDKAADDPEGGLSSNGEAVDQTRLLEQFAALHEDLADGRISLDDFEVRQEELRAKMVVE